MKRITWLSGLGLVLMSAGCNQDPESATGGAAAETCQRIFVSGMNEEAYERDVVPTISLALIGSSNRPVVNIDYQAQTVTATLTYKGDDYEASAVYREGLGCTPVIGTTAAALRAQPFQQKTVPRDEDAYWPDGAAGPRPGVVDSATLAAIDASVQQHLYPGNLNTFAVALAKDGELLYERYRNEQDPNVPIDADTPLVAYSMSKTVTSLALGVLHDQGTFQLDDEMPVAEWAAAPRGTTYRQFLNMESGLAWKESGDLVSPADSPRMVFTSATWPGYAAAKSQKYPPGAHWQYNTGNSMLLARELQRLLGATGVDRLQLSHDFFTDRVFAPAGVTSAGVQVDSEGVFGGGTYFYMTARDWLRMGQVVLDGGAGARGRVVSQAWIDFMATRGPGCLAEKGADCQYGGHIWLQSVDVQGQALDVLVFSGLMGNRVAVVPDRGVVFTRLGATVPTNSTRSDFFAALSEILAVL